jgi:flagellar biosynthesis/type III secretory pathway chaperone
MSDEKRLYHQQAVIIWEGFCRLHQQLLDMTNEEYLALLDSDIDKLEVMLPMKDEIIKAIGEIEQERIQLIEQINKKGLLGHSISKATQLIEAFEDVEKLSGVAILSNLNALLIEVIERIQEQNKKNQLFLNKAMLSLRELKEGFSGKKTFITYGADGLTRSLNR